MRNQFATGVGNEGNEYAILEALEFEAAAAPPTAGFGIAVAQIQQRKIRKPRSMHEWLT